MTFVVVDFDVQTYKEVWYVLGNWSYSKTSLFDSSVDSMVKCWFEDMRRNLTIAEWNGFFNMFNPEFIKNYSSMIMDYDWYCIISLLTQVPFRHFGKPWSFLIIEYNLKLVWIRDCQLL